MQDNNIILLTIVDSVFVYLVDTQCQQDSTRLTNTDSDVTAEL